MRGISSGVSPSGVCRASAASLLLGVLAAGCASTDIETTHYVGVFDPYEQVAQELYRVTITGHAPWYHDVKYGTGWVPAAVADLLNLDVRPGVDTTWSHTDPGGAASPVAARRRFFEMGPLGVSTEPQEHRFVIVMSADPDEFFRRVALLARFERSQAAGLEAERRALTATIAGAREDVARRLQSLEVP